MRLELVSENVAHDEWGWPWLRMRDDSWRPALVRGDGRLLPLPLPIREHLGLRVVDEEHEAA